MKKTLPICLALSLSAQCGSLFAQTSNPPPKPGQQRSNGAGETGEPLDLDAELLQLPTGVTERFSIAPYKLFGVPRSNNPEVAEIKLVQPIGGTDREERFPNVVEIVTQGQEGVARLTIPVFKDEAGGKPVEKRIEILVVDEISNRYKLYLERQIRTLFKKSNVSLLIANRRTVVVSGTVEHAEDVQPIIDLVRGVLDRSGTRGGAQAGGSGGAQAAGGGGGASQVNVVNAIRVPGSQQVQLKVVIAEIDRTKVREFGFEWSWQDLSATGLISQLTNLLGVQGDVTPPTTQNFTVSRAGQFQFNGFLRAIVTHDMAKILAEPVLVTTSGQPAFFNSGGETPYLVPQGNNTISIQYKSFGTNLRFVPTVLGEGRIRLEVRPEVSDLNPANGININGNAVPGFNTRVAETTIELESGQTFAIAGLLQSRNQATTTKVPLMGDLPLVGWAFQTKGYTQRETELLILVTPHLVDAMDERPCKLPGRESRVPNDVEFYWGSKFEPPCFQDPYRYDWRKCGDDKVTPTPVHPYDNWGRPPVPKMGAPVQDMRNGANLRVTETVPASEGSMLPISRTSAEMTTPRTMRMEMTPEEETNIAPPRPASVGSNRSAMPMTTSAARKTDGDPWSDWWAGKNKAVTEKGAIERAPATVSEPKKFESKTAEAPMISEQSEPVSEKTAGTVEVVDEKTIVSETKTDRSKSTSGGSPVSERKRSW